jgi:hypothetical protein
MATASAKEGEGLAFIAMPVETYKAFSDAAMARGLTFAQALQQAFSQWLAAAPPSK